MTEPILIAADAIAAPLLVFGLYFPRYRRRDMVVALLGINVGVLAVGLTLAASTVGAGVGLGIFGVLSIIRLRSLELDQEEIAYYFGALALGILGGIAVSPLWVSVALMAGIIAVFFIGDHPRLFRTTRHQIVTLDAAHPDEAELVERLEGLLGASVSRVRVRKLDLVNDSTTVDVRYRLDT